MTPQKRPQILIVDDEVAMVRLLEMMLKSLGDVHKVYSVPEALELVAQGLRFDCVVTDISMPEASGLSLLDSFRKNEPDVPVIVMTAFSSVPQAVETIQKGAFEYLVKPFENADMLKTVQRALQKKGLSMGETKRMPKGWICNSQAMRDFLERLERAAPGEAPLLLVGELGCGKGRAARWLHDQGPRAKKEFLSTDGRGHEEDIAWFEGSIAKVGSLYVAEVFSLNPRLQDRLMDIIREGKVRVIASTSSSPDFQALKSFRSDLFQELNRMSLRIPSLRERQEDVEALASEILSSLKTKLKLDRLELHPEALSKLKAFDFPGNVRELERILERAILECRSGVIAEKDLKFDAIELRSQLPFTIPLEDGWYRLDLLKEGLERELIHRALEKHPEKSNTQIAEILGTTRRILELRMKQYRIREGVE